MKTLKKIKNMQLKELDIGIVNMWYLRQQLDWGNGGNAPVWDAHETTHQSGYR